MKSVEASERMKEAFEIRLTLINLDLSVKTEYEKNENDIVTMKTQHQIEMITEKIVEKKLEFSESFSRYIEELEFEDKNIM